MLGVIARCPIRFFDFDRFPPARQTTKRGIPYKLDGSLFSKMSKHVTAFRKCNRSWKLKKRVWNAWNIFPIFPFGKQNVKQYFIHPEEHFVITSSVIFLPLFLLLQCLYLKRKYFFFGQCSSFSLVKQFRYSDNVEFARYSYFPRCISRASMREGKVPSSLKANTNNQVCKICQELTATKLWNR